MSTEYSQLSARARRTMRTLKVRTPRRLAKFSWPEVLAVPGCGQATALELDAYLELNGLDWETDPVKIWKRMDGSGPLGRLAPLLFEAARAVAAEPFGIVP